MTVSNDCVMKFYLVLLMVIDCISIVKSMDSNSDHYKPVPGYVYQYYVDCSYYCSQEDYWKQRIGCREKPYTCEDARWDIRYKDFDMPVLRTDKYTQSADPSCCVGDQSNNPKCPYKYGSIPGRYCRLIDYLENDGRILVNWEWFTGCNACLKLDSIVECSNGQVITVTLLSY